jgi:hypothetical protein
MALIITTISFKSVRGRHCAVFIEESRLTRRFGGCGKKSTKQLSAEFLLISATNEIINDFLKRVFSGPNAFFLLLCTQSYRERSQNITRILAVNQAWRGPN